MRHTKYYKDDPEVARRRGRKHWVVTSMAHRIAGGKRPYAALTVEEKTSVRVAARQLLELGADIGTAQRNEGTDKRGFVYVITNPAWPGYVKIGRAYDPEARQGDYQTGSPLRDYELESSVYFDDCHFAESEIHARLSPLRAAGEWFTMTPTQARSAIETLRQTL